MSREGRSEVNSSICMNWEEEGRLELGHGRQINRMV